MFGISHEDQKRLEDAAEEILKTEPDFAMASLRLTARMLEMGFTPGKPGCAHLEEGWCGLCVERKVRFAEILLKIEQAAILKEAAKALHNPERYGIPKVEELIAEIERRAHLCEETRSLVSLMKAVPGEFNVETVR